MASFTDEIIKFNPYISKIPVDDYIRSGMEMQRRFDEGVQQTQNYISTIAGLPVITNGDKTYITKKLGEMRSRVESVVGADYSKQSFVNQIGGLAGQIVSDPRIKTALDSAAKVSKLQGDIEYLRREKPELYSDANAERAMQHVSDYMERGMNEAGVSYNGPTAIIRGTGELVRKKIMDAVKQVDSDASVLIDDKGGVSVKSTHKDLTPEKIQTLVQATLDAKDYQILGNEGWYNTRGYSDLQVKDSVSNYYRTRQNDYDRMVKSIDDELKKTDALTPEQRLYYSQQVEIYKRYRDEYGKNANNVENAFGTDQWNRDLVTQSYWVDNLSSSMGQALQRHVEDVDLEVSPFLLAQKVLAEINKLDADTKEKLKEAEPGNATFMFPSPTQPAAPLTADTVRDQIGSLEEAKVDNMNAALKSMLIDNNGQRTTEADQYLDEDGNWLPGGLKKMQGAMGKSMGNYYLSALGYQPYDKNPLPANNTNAREGFFNHNVLSEIQRQKLTKDAEIKRRAKAELKGDIKLDFTDKVKIGNKEMTLGDVYRIYNEGTTEEIKKVQVPGSTPIETPFRVLKKGTEYEKILKEAGQSDEGLTQNDFRKVLRKVGLDTNKLDKKVNELYKEYTKTIEPYKIGASFSDKDKKTQWYATLVNSVRQSGQTLDAEILNEEGLKFSELKSVDFSNAEITGGLYSPDGKKLYAEATFDAKREGTKGSPEKFTARFDVTEMRKTATGIPWFDAYFQSDSHPELTASMMATGKPTIFDEKNNFQGSLFVKSRPDMGRFYQILVERNEGGIPQFFAKIAVPIGKGQFEMRNLNDPRNESVIFKGNNAGQVIQMLEMVYANSPDIMKREQSFLRTR